MKIEKLWVATLIRKDNGDQVYSIMVSSDDKYDAITKANHEFAQFYPNYFQYAYVWVEEKKP